MMSEFGEKTTSDRLLGISEEQREKMNKKSVREQWVLDVQWSDCPIEVEEEVQRAWDEMELGNDNHMFKHHVGDRERFPDMYPLISAWCRHNGVPDGEYVWVHWWW